MTNNMQEYVLAKEIRYGLTTLREIIADPIMKNYITHRDFLWLINENQLF